ncbi:hypothetical protein [Arenicella xantha]|uniref:GIY-YIG domain-containing protein n=1 Tax=Arenicella xantha TaxID=644221 RepID=A0A395JPX7_9GAMM|nr:hypothetical protein [Arenicella xantha]RBP50760.1 hypothetical protein DFR28_102172 [Arenicella xantha]
MTLDDLDAAVDIYCETYRHSSLEAFKRSELIDLFPEKSGASSLVGSTWVDPWPYLDEAGVYAFLTSSLEVFYIGKASMGNGLGYRVNSYCTYADKLRTTCKLRHEWENFDVRYVYMIVVPDTSRFEAPALEEYLLSKIKTVANKNGLAP